ncbi:MAG: glycoside hydrolase family 113 [Acidimicrobiales bacterium]
MKRGALILGMSVMVAAGIPAVSCAAVNGGSGAARHANKPVAQTAGKKHTTILKGIDVAWGTTSKTNLPWVESEAHKIVDYVESLDANTISINFKYFQKHLDSDSVYTNAGTPTVAELAEVIQIAQSAGLMVQLRPLLSVVDSDKPRGVAMPSNPSAWMGSLFKTLRPYVKLAQKYRVEAFVWGSEFTKMTAHLPEKDWTGLIERLKKNYTGRLQYAAGHAAYLVKSGPLSPNMPGYKDYVDGYFPVNAGPHASINRLIAGWQQWLKVVPKSTLSNTVISEVGIPVASDAYEMPWGSPPTSLKYLYMQQRWFTMVCDIVKSDHMKGVFFWRLDFPIDPYTVNGDSKALTSDAFADRPGADEIKACYSRTL